MHICFVIGAMNYSGAEKVLTTISRNLYISGEKVSIILLEKEAGIENLDGIDIYGAKTKGNRIQRVVNRWKNIRGIIKSISPDVIVSFGYVCNVNTVPAVMCLKVPLIVCERNDPTFDPRKKIEKLTRDLLYPLAEGYVFQTERIKQYFSKAIQKRSCIIPNPVPFTDIRWELEKANNSIATVARLDNFQKDHLTMFNAFAIFSQKYPDYVLNVYGDGPDKERYIRHINDMGMNGKILLHGKISNPLGRIAQSKVFILTSRFEGMPNALMEAMSIGMPCISTDCGGGGARVLFETCDTGIITQIGNTNEIAEALEQLITSDSNLIEQGQNAIRIYDYFSEAIVCEKWKQYINLVHRG